MAKKPAAAATHELPPAMDYAQHEATYAGFITFVKWGILAMVFVVLSLYAFIEAHQPIIGALLLLAIPVLIIGVMVMGSRRS
ncbi:MAG: aa3-type cytochrome c oxidase subunit IV [Hyphomicrobiales bacterium]|nr:MAG: aa3-type cytochrome c oxidase subunit IV [Hyphomicrobiales bacterium]